MAQESFAFDYLATPEVGFNPKKKAKGKLHKKPEIVEDTGVKKLTKKELVKAILTMAVIGFVFMLLIYTTATKTSIKYSLNKIEAENKVLSNKVIVLQSNIAGSNSFDSIKETATNELGMIYADASQCVYINNYETNPNLVDMIKEKAYS